MTARVRRARRGGRFASGSRERQRVIHIKGRLTGAGLEVPGEFTPRRLRGSFVTAMRRAKAEFEELETYVGHALGNVTDRHYDYIDLERLRTISALAVRLFVAATEKEGAMKEKTESA